MVKSLRYSLICIVLLSYAGYVSWQLHAAGSARDRMPPAALDSITPNNGSQGTTFSLYLQPYWIFSEDYHLYYLRAKRMAAFGPVDDILEPSRSRRYDLRNAAQLVITLLPALYGENIHHYAMIYFLYIAASLLVIFWATNAVTRHPYLALCSTVLVVTLVVEMRFYRISTTLFSLPLLILILARLMRSGNRGSTSAPHVPDFVLGAALLVLSALDVWAYLFGLSILCFFSVGESVRRRTVNLIPLVLTSLPSLLYFGATALVYSSKDLSLRAGMGLVRWNIPDMALLFNNSLFLYIAAGIVVLYAFDRRSPGAWMMISIVLGYAVCAFGLSLGVGVDIYQVKHFIVFLKPLVAWVAVVALAAIDWKSAMDKNAFTAALWRSLDSSAFRWRDRAATLLFLGAALTIGYSNLASSLFLEYIQLGTVHFANPKKHERLVTYLQGSVRDQKGRSFLTLSPELNYYIAFHSEFDMLFPSGFPLHSTRSNDDIAIRMAGIFRLLRVQPHLWESMLQPGQDHVSWMRSRTAAAKGNYLYDLLHRLGLRDIARTTMRGAVAQELAVPTQDLLAPDYILIDEVASYMQVQIPEQYRLIYADPGLQLYQKVPDLRRATAPGHEQAVGRGAGPAERRIARRIPVTRA